MPNPFGSGRHTVAAAAVIAAGLMVASCKREPPPPPPPPPPPARAPAAEPAAVTVVDIHLGTAIEPNLDVSTPRTSFGRYDTIIAAVITRTRDPMAETKGTLGIRWHGADGRPISEETQEVNFAGTVITDFQAAVPAGWQPGAYVVEVSIDGQPAGETRFEVR